MAKSTQEREVLTDYGYITIEIVECDSCGRETPVEQAVDFTIGDNEGWACSACRGEGPISYPSSSDEQEKDDETTLGDIVFGLFAMATLLCIFLPVILLFLYPFGVPMILTVGQGASMMIFGIITVFILGAWEDATEEE